MKIFLQIFLVSIRYVLFGTRLNPFLRGGSPQNSPPLACEPKIRRVPELIRHLIGDVWAQHRGMPMMGRTCECTLRARTRVCMDLKANYEISLGHWQRPPLSARPRVSRA